MIRLLNLGPAEHKEVAIYVVNQRIPNVRELRELLRSGAIRRHQLGAKGILTPTHAYELLRYEAAPAILQTFEIR